MRRLGTEYTFDVISEYIDENPATLFMRHISSTPCCVSFCQLCDLYENDSIFDKFECCLSGDGQRVATGSYRFVLPDVTVMLSFYRYEDPIFPVSRFDDK